MLAALPVDGSGARFVQLSGLQTTATDNTGGVPTCYVVFAMSGGVLMGNTDALCGAPGTGTISAAGQLATTSTASVRGATATPVRSASPAVQNVSRNASSVRQTVREIGPRPRPAQPGVGAGLLGRGGNRQVDPR